MNRMWVTITEQVQPKICLLIYNFLWKGSIDFFLAKNIHRVDKKSEVQLMGIYFPRYQRKSQNVL